MERQQTVAILGELLALEQRSLAPRLLESTVSISTLAAPALTLVKRMAAATQENSSILVKMILDLGGTPPPRNYPISTAELHFQDLTHVLPRLVADEETIVRSFTLAAQRLSPDPRALAVVNSILQRHQRQLKELASATNPHSLIEKATSRVSGGTS